MHRAYRALLISIVAVIMPLALASLAWAQTGGEVRACVNQDGEIRIIGTRETCTRGESLLTWNMAGPQGLRGLQGRTGPAGPAWPPGNIESIDALDGTPCNQGRGTLRVTYEARGKVALLCVPATCAPPQALCSGTCTDLSTDVNNCGVCGYICPGIPNASSSCSAGECTMGQCRAGYANCDGSYANGCETGLRTDRYNCGSCGRTCATGQLCSNGQCVSN